MTSNVKEYTIELKLPEFPMKEDTSEVKTEDYIIAYIDILGITNTINNDKFNKQLKIIFDLYNNALSNINTVKHAMAIEDIKIKIFSDNILFALKLNNNYTKEELTERLYTLVFTLRDFQLDALMYGYTMRGGITLGKLFINNTFVYGKGLLDSYIMESKLAIFPRIVIDEDLLKNIQYNNRVTLYLEKDFDNLYFIDYLTLLFSETCDKTLANIRKIIIYLTQQNSDKKVKQKYYWLINKFNERCNENNKGYSIDIENEPIYKIQKQNYKEEK